MTQDSPLDSQKVIQGGGYASLRLAAHSPLKIPLMRRSRGGLRVIARVFGLGLVVQAKMPLH